MLTGGRRWKPRSSHEGRHDYLTKPYSITELDVRVKQAAEKRRLRVDNLRLRKQLARQSGLPEIVSVSPAMMKWWLVERGLHRSFGADHRRIRHGQGTEGPAFIVCRRGRRFFHRHQLRGVSGVAVGIGTLRLRSGRVFRRAGHKLGLIELADGGTLFLDEGDRTAGAAQAKLLRDRDENIFPRRRVRKVGSTRTSPRPTQRFSCR